MTQFGVDSEKLNLLQSLKASSLHDVMKLNILTVFVIVLLGLFSVLTGLVNEEKVRTLRKCPTISSVTNQQWCKKILILLNFLFQQISKIECIFKIYISF